MLLCLSLGLQPWLGVIHLSSPSDFRDVMGRDRVRNTFLNRNVDFSKLLGKITVTIIALNKFSDQIFN